VTNGSVTMEKGSVILICGHRKSPNISLLGDVYNFLQKREKYCGPSN
jgi:hypothetical protein